MRLVGQVENQLFALFDIDSIKRAHLMAAVAFDASALLEDDMSVFDAEGLRGTDLDAPLASSALGDVEGWTWTVWCASVEEVEDRLENTDDYLIMLDDEREGLVAEYMEIVEYGNEDAE